MTNTTAVIVALPSAVDPIRLVGDEEKHATLLFFGETASLPEEAKTAILETLGTASTMFRPFSEEMIGVERLGSDVPPALVSKVSGRCLTQIRDALQINPAIATYMSNAAQFPNYVPHVTLGYPDWADEVIMKSLCSSLYEVKFDRIALWWNDERFEFKLGKEEGGQLKMKAPLDEFLAHAAVDYALEHATKGPTVQDVVDGLSTDQRDVFDLIVGAAFEDVELPFDENVQKTYAAFSTTQKSILDFVVAGVLSKESSVAHSDDVVDNFLAHFGVKGMKWGVRKRDESSGVKSPTRSEVEVQRRIRADARAVTKAGTGTLGSAHIAALKSTGHRVANGFLGDKTFWKRAAITAGVVASGVAVSALAPAVLPASLLTTIGSAAAGTSGVAGHVIVDGTLVSLQSIGQAAVAGAGLTTSLIGGTAATAVNVGSNVVRAARGNARVAKSFSTLGQNMYAAQQSGSKQVQKVLSRNGSIKKSTLTHSDDLVDDFLEHHGIKGMKWGIRRDRSGSAGGSKKSGNGKSEKKAEKEAARARPGSVAVKKDEDGNAIGVVVKKKDGTWKDTELSADAERFIKTRMKEGHEMSDVELRTALNRAQMVKQYDDLFGEKPGSELQARVNEMKLQKEYRDLSAQLNPPQKTAVSKFVSGATKAYGAFSTLDKATGGAVGQEIGKKLGAALNPAATAANNAEAARKKSLDDRKADAQVRKAEMDVKLAEQKLKTNKKNSKK